MATKCHLRKLLIVSDNYSSVFSFSQAPDLFSTIFTIENRDVTPSVLGGLTLFRQRSFVLVSCALICSGILTKKMREALYKCVEFAQRIGFERLEFFYEIVG